MSTYITIYKPAKALAEEIVEDGEKVSISPVAWGIAATVAAPAILLAILLGKSETLKNKIALKMIEGTENV